MAISAEDAGGGSRTGRDDRPGDGDPPASACADTRLTSTYVPGGAVCRGPATTREALMTASTRTALDAGFRGGIDVRVSLRAGAGDGNSAFDGAWYPRTRDLAIEVPELIAELDRREVRVERFTYALDAWAPVARKVVVADRT